MLAPRPCDERIAVDRRTPPRVAGKRWLAAAFLLFGGALAARWVALDGRLLANDESFSWRVIQYDTGDMLRRVVIDATAPGHYVALKTWRCMWGDSLAAMRWLSVVWGMLAVAVAAALGAKAISLRTIAGGMAPVNEGYSQTTDGHRRMQGAALFAALMAVATLQITGSRTARMYAQGAALAAIAALCLVWALQNRRRDRFWRAFGPWLAYGVAMAAFCYTHHFAFFTAIAHSLFVAGYLFVRWRRGRANVGVQLLGFCLGGMLAVALYSPWAPLFLRQAASVYKHFWIPEITADETQWVLFQWSTGLDSYNATLAAIWFCVLAALSVFVAVRGGAAGWFFLLQAWLPWMFCVGLSYYSGRSILQLRYLTFAQIGLFGMWVVALQSCQSGWTRSAVAALALWLPVMGLCQSLPSYAEPADAAIHGWKYLAHNYRRGDVVLVARAAAVNRTLFHAQRFGVNDMDVRCYLSLFRDEGHQVHVAALTPANVWLDDDPRLRRVRRVWVARRFEQSVAPPSEFRLVRSRKFTGGGDSEFEVSSYVRR